MITVSLAGAAATLTTALAALDLTLPKTTRAALDRLDTIRAKGLPIPGGDLAAAIVAALDADRDPAADPEVQRLVTADQLRGETTYRPAITHCEQLAADALRADLPGILAQLAEIVNHADTALRAAHTQLPGITDLDDTAAILNRGGTAAKTWGEATTATQSATHARQAWRAAIDATRTLDRPNVKDGRTLLDVAALNLEQTERYSKSTTLWQLVGDGIRLDLATLDGYRARTAALADETRQRTEQAERTERDRRKTLQW